ncbi:MAG: copper resistance protein B [Pseudoxanthomonas sp.]
MNALPKPTIASVVLALAFATPALAQHAPACTPEHAAMGHCRMPDADPHAPAAQDRPPQPPSACSPEHAAMGHCSLPAKDEACPPEHAAMGHCTPSVPPPAEDADCPPEHAAMGHCTPRKATLPEPREPIPILTDADRAAAFPPLHGAHTHGTSIHSLVLFNRLEAWDTDPGSGQAWEGKAWIGGDVDRLWLRSEGERVHGRTESSDLELLYGRSVNAWWDVVAGVRQDFRPADAQTWAAVGVQGMAPYRFEVAATAYLGESGRTAAKLEVEYDLLLSNRLILQPLLEADFNGKDDPSRRTGSGLATAEFGLRLRYEITRRFAPYVGVAHERAFGSTADYRRADYRRDEGEDARDTRWVAGVRFWF